MLFMGSRSLWKSISSGLSGLKDRFGDEARQAAAPPIDAISQEIYQLEQSLAEIATRPSRIIRAPKPLTEQQKIIDLAG
ncbi:MAG: hypothetical protein Kow0031_33820 [Anaerolineae bacterium]